MNKIITLLSVLILVVLSGTTNPQNQPNYTIRGIVIEQPSQEMMQQMRGGMQGNRSAQRDSARRPVVLNGANLVLYAQVDTLTQYRGANAGADGRFEIARVPEGEYIMKVSYVGYVPRRLTVSINGADINRLMVFMQEDPLILDEVRISGLRPEVEVRGDTTVYNADGVKVNLIKQN